MEERSQRAKLGNLGPRWQLVLICGVLIGLGLLLTSRISSLADQAQLQPTTQAPTIMIVAAPSPVVLPSRTRQPSSTPSVVLFPSTTPHATAHPQPNPPLPINQLGALATLDPELIKPYIKPDALPVAVATPDIFATATSLPTVTAIPELALERHIYVINSLEDPTQFQLQRADPTGLVPIASVDAYSDRFIAILPTQATLLIPRNLQLVAFDIASGRERWSYPLLPKIPHEFNGMLALDQAQTGIYILEQSDQPTLWRLSYRALTDGRALTPTKHFKFQPDSPPLLTAAGQIWFLDQRELYRLDSATERLTSFGMSYNQVLMGDGQQTELAIFRTNNQLGLINWSTGAERNIRLNQPIVGESFNGLLSHDQTMLLVGSQVMPAQPDIGQWSTYHSVYRLTDGELQTRERRVWPKLIYPATTADQWLSVTKNPMPKLIIEHRLDIDRWNSSTDQTDERYHFSTNIPQTEIIWVGEVRGTALQPLEPAFQTALTPLPTGVRSVAQLLTPASAPPHTKIGLLEELPGRYSARMIHQVWGDQERINVAKMVVKLLPRPNQPPLVLSRPQIMTWQLYDPATEQVVEWQFDTMILLDHLPRFNPLLAASGEQMVAVVQQDLRRTDAFTAEHQLVIVNAKTGEWNVIADSANWSALPYVRPLAWQGQTIYFQQVDSNKQRQWIWQVALDSSFRPEILLELPLKLANPFIEWPDQAPVVVSPNQRWLLYSVANAQHGMTLHILDLVAQQSHELQLPLESANGIDQRWFSPTGNHMALTIPDAATTTDYLALYDFEQQQLYQLDHGQHFGFAQPFLWSPDGQWLAVLFGDFSPYEQVSIFDVEQAQLVAKTRLDTLWQPIGLMNDGQTILTRFHAHNTIQQMHLIDSEWQVIWQMQLPERHKLIYIYPR